MSACFEQARKKQQRARMTFCGAAFVCLALLALFALVAPTPTHAQGIPFNGVMPNVGAMAYDLKLTRAWSPQRMRMTGYASSRGGMVRWVHCLQPSVSPVRVCQLMVNGETGERFFLPAQMDLERWMTAASGFGWLDRMQPADGFSGSMQMSNQFRMGDWNASGSFRYWR